MGLKLNKESYTKIINEDLEEVNKYIPDGITKDHITLVLCNSIDMHYPETTRSELLKEELEKRMPNKEEMICGFIVWMNKIERAHFDFTKEKLKGYVKEYLISVKLDISLQPKEMECPRHIGEPMIDCPRCAMDPKYYSHTSCFHFDLHQGRNHCCCEEYNSVTCTGYDCGFFKGEGEG